MNKKKVKTLVDLIDNAIKIAEDRLLRRSKASDEELAPLSGLEAVVAALQERREQALSGTLQPFEGRDSVGLNNELLSWGEWGTPLFEALQSIEEYYRDNF